MQIAEILIEGLIAYREGRGLSWRVLADEVGLSHNTLYSIVERGSLSMKTCNHLLAHRPLDEWITLANNGRNDPEPGPEST